MRGDLSDGLVLDAVRLRLIEIGEAVKALDRTLLVDEPDIAWRDAAGISDWLAHHYFDRSAAIVAATVDENLPPLVAAVRRLLKGWVNFGPQSRWRVIDPTTLTLHRVPTPRFVT